MDLELADDYSASGNAYFPDHRGQEGSRGLGDCKRYSSFPFPEIEGADGEVSQFGALATALASTIGTGNIIGVGTAIAPGGPGAVLWCWLTGVFGIATKYGESLIAVKYRVQNGRWTNAGRRHVRPGAWAEHALAGH